MHGNRLLSKRRLSVLAASAAGALLGSVIVAAPSLAGVAGDQDFTVVGSQSFIVPEDVTVLGIMAVGGGGGAAYFSSQSTYAEGGSGAYVTAVHQVQPGQTITVNVGGGGQASSPGGVNGAGGGGGAASSVFYQDLASDPQRIVAGGGGAAPPPRPDTSAAMRPMTAHSPVVPEKVRWAELAATPQGAALAATGPAGGPASRAAPAVSEVVTAVTDPRT